MGNNRLPSELSRFGLLTKMVTFIGLAGIVTALVVLPVVGGVGLASRNSAQAFTSFTGGVCSGAVLHGSKTGLFRFWVAHKLHGLMHGG